MKENYYVKIEARGHFDIVTVDEENKLSGWYKEIDCSTIDIQEGLNLPEPYVLIIDDEALLKEKPILNPLASLLYGTKKHGCPIFGDVLIGKDYVTEEGEVETGGYGEDEVQKIVFLVLDLMTGRKTA